MAEQGRSQIESQEKPTPKKQKKQKAPKINIDGSITPITDPDTPPTTTIHVANQASDTEQDREEIGDQTPAPSETEDASTPAIQIMSPSKGAVMSPSMGAVRSPSMGAGMSPSKGLDSNIDQLATSDKEILLPPEELKVDFEGKGNITTYIEKGEEITFVPGVLPVQLFPGAKGLASEDTTYLTDPSNATLTSSLETLGTQTFSFIAATRPMSLGHSVVGYSGNFCRPRSQKEELVLLPYTFSINFARINIFLRILITLIIAAAIASFSYDEAAISGINWDEFDKCLVTSGKPDQKCFDEQASKQPSTIGKAWAVGTCLSLVVLFLLSRMYTIKEGVIPFLRSMGTPSVEEYMFSYSWARRPEEIRTVAKAMWNSGVGVWIDVVKLVSGDKIRHVVRTMMKRCYRSVVFLSKPYINSLNCCVELNEAIQNPDKMIICILEPLPEGVICYIEWLMSRHSNMKVIRGIEALIPVLHEEITDVNDLNAYKWWQSQQISVAGVPEHVIPQKPIPMFSMNPCKFLTAPKDSLYVGPVFYAGNGLQTGLRFFPPFFFIAAITATILNAVDFTYVFLESAYHDPLTYLILAAIACITFAPFFETKKLLNTRFFVHPVLKPLLASRALGGGVKIWVEGRADDPIVATLREFVKLLGHAPDPRLNQEVDYELDLHPNTVNVIVIDSIPTRDKWFADEEKMKRVFQSSIVVYSGDDNPFTNDAMGKTLMKYLVLVKKREGTNLAKSIFSGISVRVVSLLHLGIECREEAKAMQDKLQARQSSTDLQEGPRPLASAIDLFRRETSLPASYY